MQLEQKGAEANVGGFENAIVKLTWTTKMDFDLAALYLQENGETGLIYYRNLGDLNVFPFMQLDKDAGVGDKVEEGGVNEETMRILKLASPISKVLILAWDYGAITKNTKCRFNESDVKVSVKTDTGVIDVTLDSTEMGNISCVCEININEFASTLKNRSDVAAIKGLNSSDELYNLFKDAA